MTTSNIILMEYNAQQRCFHYNHYNGKGRGFQSEPLTNGWVPLIFIDDTAASSKQFYDETNGLIGLEIEDIIDGIIDCLQRLNIPYKTIQ